MSSREYQRPVPSWPGRSFVVRLVLVIVFLILAVQAVSFYVNSLWFQSLGFEPVYWYRLRAQGLVFLAFTLATTLALWVIFRAVIPASTYTRRPFVEIAGETIIIPTTESLKRWTGPAAVVIGILFGLSFSTNWYPYAQFLNRVPTPNVSDPVFGHSLSFYFFSLPVLESVSGWFLAISLIGAVAAILMAATDVTASFKGVSLAVSLLLLAIAFQVFVNRYALLFRENGLFTGVRYVDANIVLPGCWFIIAALIAGSAIAAGNIRAGRIRNLAIAGAIPALTYLVAGVLAPAYVSTFVVRPNELVRETPYIRNNIEFTRKAYGLEAVEDISFEPRVTNAIFDPAAHSDTLSNIRLWDWRALQSTLRQIQEIRTYYDFPDIDVDRYMINGNPESVMLAVRELSVNKLPAGSRNWVNERLIYTHGYGVTMNPVNSFTKEGLPEFLLSDMPVKSATPSLHLTRPEVYFGEITDWPVYAKTRQKEFNYPEGDLNNYTTYEGTGGIRMGSFFRRLALAWTVGDLSKVPFSDDIGPDSVLLMRRNIRDRAAELAPFLLFDQDPYIVVGEDGGLYWMMDAFTTSNRYPYGRHLSLENQPLNYIRNSVKVVTDAYNGTVHFYVFDPDDPLIQSYEKMFPSLFSPASEMPAFLRSHVRYPDLLFRAQALIYSTYHVENEQVFYNREDIWTIAQQGRSQQGAQSAGAIEPFFVMIRFPGSSQLEFTSILPFTPANRNNLIGWIAGRSDGDEYGKLRSYHFPKTRFVDGPLQIQARIDQDPELSSQLTLWNQQGSTVIRGNLLVLPLEDTLLFAEPIYLQAERSPMPELRIVVLATQDRLAYASRFPEALSRLVAGESEGPPGVTSATPAPTTSEPPGPVPESGSDIQSLVERANRALGEYQRLTSEGKLGEAGSKLEELKRTLEEMNHE